MNLGRRIWAAVAIVAAMPIGAWALYFQPHLAEKAAVMSNLQAQEARLTVLRQASGTAEQAEQSADKLNKAVAFLLTKLTRQNEIDKVVKGVWQLAQANRLGLKNIQTAGTEDASVAAGPYPAQLISFQIEGDFGGFYSFLLALENEPRIVRVQKMGVKALEGAGQGQVQASLLMSVFYEPGAS